MQRIQTLFLLFWLICLLWALAFAPEPLAAIAAVALGGLLEPGDRNE